MYWAVVLRTGYTVSGTAAFWIAKGFMKQKACLNGTGKEML